MGLLQTPKYFKRTCLAAVVFFLLGALFLFVVLPLSRVRLPRLPVTEEDGFHGSIDYVNLYADHQVVEVKIINGRYDYAYIHYTDEAYGQALNDKYQAGPIGVNVGVMRRDHTYRKTPAFNQQHDKVRITFEWIDASVFAALPNETRVANYDIEFPLNSVVMQNQKVTIDEPAFALQGLSGQFYYRYLKAQSDSYSPSFPGP